MKSTKDLVTIDNGSLLLRGTPIHHYTVVREIGRGANGIVFEVVNTLLDRREALKIWLTLRPSDARNKIDQGMKEARKASIMAPAHVPVLYHANIVEGLFYATMEYIDGVTLKSCLNNSRDLIAERGLAIVAGYRINYAAAYIDALRATTKEGLLHGDPHWENVIMVRASNHSVESYPLAKLIDFGTSHFTKADKFDVRHWRIVEEQLERILKFFPKYSEVKNICERWFPKNKMHASSRDYFSELMLYMRDELLILLDKGNP